MGCCQSRRHLENFTSGNIKNINDYKNYEKVNDNDHFIQADLNNSNGSIESPRFSPFKSTYYNLQ